MARKYEDYPPVEGLGAIAAYLPSVDEFKTLLIIGGSAGAALIGGRMLFSKVPFLAGLHWGIKAALKVGIGAMGGLLISAKSRHAGVGFGAGMVVSAIVDDALPMLPIPGLSGYGAVDDFELFGDGYSDVSVHERPNEEYAYGGFEVEEYPEYVPA